MQIKDNVNLSELNDNLVDIAQSLDYIKDYGHVGHFDVKEEDIKKKADEALEAMRKAQTLLGEIAETIEENFGH